jgi:hypothetical protein
MSGSDLTTDQANSLQALGLREQEVDRFLKGFPVAFSLPTESSPGIGVAQRRAPRLRAGIVELHDPGGGVKTLARFRRRAFDVAISFGLSEVELFGAAIINGKLADLLARQEFDEMDDQCPDELGDEIMTIRAKVFAVPRSAV